MSRTSRTSVSPIAPPEREWPRLRAVDDTDERSRAIFEEGPFFRSKRWIPVLSSHARGAVKRAFVAVLLAWVPLVLLASVQFFVLHDTRARSFAHDLGAHARFLVALPLLVVAPRYALPRMRLMFRGFARSGVLAPSAHDRYDRLLAGTVERIRSPALEIILVLLAYALTLSSIYFLREPVHLPWRTLGLVTSEPPSISAYWYTFVSNPLLLVLITSWLWRQLMWAVLLFRISRLRMHLVPSHPDRMGGLRFVREPVRGCWPVSAAFGTIVAGATANQIRLFGVSMLAVRVEIVALAAFVGLIMLAPLLVLTPTLVRWKEYGRYVYGRLAVQLGADFERAWITPKERLGDDALERPDFSATIDLYSVVANTERMKSVPFALEDVAVALLPSLVPFVPFALFVLPAQTVFERLMALGKMFI